MVSAQRRHGPGRATRTVPGHRTSAPAPAPSGPSWESEDPGEERRRYAAYRSDDDEPAPKVSPGKEKLYDLFAEMCHALDLETRDGQPSLEKLAKAAGLGKGTLANIIRTPYVPKAETLNKVSALAEWDEDLLLEAAGLRSAPRHVTLSAEEEVILSAFRGADRAAVDYALTLVRAALDYATGRGRGTAPVLPPDPAPSAASARADRRTGAVAPPAPTAD